MTIKVKVIIVFVLHIVMILVSNFPAIAAQGKKLECDCHFSIWLFFCSSFECDENRMLLLLVCTAKCLGQ
jgi:hypothetical protein